MTCPVSSDSGRRKYLATLSSKIKGLNLEGWIDRDSAHKLINGGIYFRKHHRTVIENVFLDSVRIGCCKIVRLLGGKYNVDVPTSLAYIALNELAAQKINNSVDLA